MLSLFLNDKVINTSLRRSLEAVERELVQHALKSTNGNIATAKKLDISGNCAEAYNDFQVLKSK